MTVDEQEFEDLVFDVVETLPREFRERIRNVRFAVEAAASPQLLQRVGVPPGHTLFGLYQGVPLPRRGASMPLFPDVITIFREPLLRHCPTPEALRAEVRRTVLHELAHYFGISDDRLHELGAY